MARRFRMCVVEGCKRRSQLGQLVCKDHEGTELGMATSRQVLKLEREIKSLALAESEEERRVAAKRFQQRVERGDFAAIFSGQFQKLVEQGAEQGLENLAGALQIAVIRLMMEERDPTKMATALSRVAHAYANVMRTEDALMQNDYFVDEYQPQTRVYSAKSASAKEHADSESETISEPIDADWADTEKSVTPREGVPSEDELHWSEEESIEAAYYIPTGLLPDKKHGDGTR